MSLPLFNGVSYNRLTEILGDVRLEFLKFQPGEKIITANSVCDEVTFVLHGSVEMVFTHKEHGFSLRQNIESLSLISPDFLFGRRTIYPYGMTSIDHVSVMKINKRDLLKLIRFDDIVLLNYLNILSSDAQKLIDGIMAVSGGSIEQRIAFRILALAQPGAKEITLSSLHGELHGIFGVVSTAFYDTLEAMKNKGLIDYDPREIRVRSLSGLRSTLLDTLE